MPRSSRKDVAELHARVFARAMGYCEYPTCDAPAAQMCHIHSRGMGGSAEADTDGNNFAGCDAHANVSDGLPPPGGNAFDYLNEIRLLVPNAVIGRPGLAYEVAEAMTEHIRRKATQ